MATRINRLRPRIAMANLSAARPLDSAATSITSSLRLVGRALQRRNREVLTRCPLCAICEASGRISQATECDHRLPLVDGGTDDDGNVWALCSLCHRRKTAEEASRRARGLPMPLPDLPPMKPRERKFTIA